LLILLFGLGNLIVFSLFFTFPTVKLASFLLSFISETTSYQNIILFNTHIIQLIPACIALSAYYLIFILVFSTKGIYWKQRIRILVFSCFIFLIFNVLRIFILVLVLHAPFFNALHVFLWYFISTLAVFLIWILNIKLFKIKKIPIYSDVRYLIELRKKRK
jgi:exosortase/archaeosortase family protein